MSDKAARSSIWLLVLLGFVAIGSLQETTDSHGADLAAATKKAAILTSEPLIPQLPVLRALSLGNPSVVADLLWLNTIQYFGSGNPYGKYPSLGPLLNNITALDSKYEYPYEFGLVTLPFMDQSQSAVNLGLQAQKALPGNGLLTYYLATVYHLNIKDYRLAAQYYQLAAKQEGAPSAATTLAATALSKLDEDGNDRIVAREFWRTVYQNAKDPEEKQRAEGWFTHMDMVYTLEQANGMYKQKTGAYAFSQEELVSAGILTKVLVSPVNRVFEIDGTTGKVNFEKLVNEE